LDISYLSAAQAYAGFYQYNKGGMLCLEEMEQGHLEVVVVEWEGAEEGQAWAGWEETRLGLAQGGAVFAPIAVQ